MINLEKTSLTGMSQEEKRMWARQLLKGRDAQAESASRNAALVSAQPEHRRSEDIPPEFYRFDLYPGYLTLEKHAEIMRSIGIPNPYFSCHQDISNNTITISNQEYINYSGYNYLGLSGDPDVAAAAKAAIDQYGTSVSASRIVSGEIPLHRELEQALAKLVGTESCIVFVSGYGTNVSTIGYLFGPKDLIVHDSLIHNSLITGCLLSGARRIPFPHNDWQALDRLLEENRRYHERVLIIIEGVYSMDGDIPALPQFIDIKKRHKAFLMVDEAHSMGVLGLKGFGIGEHFGVDSHDVDIWMGTLSKTFASCGGYIAGTHALIENLKYSAPGGILYSIGISPANAGAALAAIHKLIKEPERVARLQARAALFLQLAQSRGLDTGPSAGSAVVPVIVRDSIQSLKLAHNLFKRNVNVQAVLYPAVPENEARLRFFITAQHTEDQLRHTVAAVAEELAKCGPVRSA